MEVTTIYFYIPKQVTLLDLAGVLEVFKEAKSLGLPYQLEFISSTPTIISSSGLALSSVMHFSKTNPKENDMVFISGFSSGHIPKIEEDSAFFDWLAFANAQQTTIASICNGAFILAKSGLLDFKECTTHWKLIEKFTKDFPLLKVQSNVLFTKADNLYTSAGIVTGIDLALFLIEDRHGKEVATTIAKELVVYKRRQGSDQQESVYLQNRNHRDEKIHTVQDWIIYNLEKTSTIDFLADLVHIGPRNLTRIFKKQTGITIAEYRTKLRIEKAKSLLAHSDYKVESIAHLCGYKTSKQLRVVLETHLQELPMEIKKNRLS
ncbi:GlxA family transcriptional regulator [Flavobacterium sp. ENC]|uniref:GlxA family transcriptional regulator n=1 Tax=Flavobacterium sp. ENC TaxID=2897330 RepID=UPI001E2CD693|nr:helix-turn-helix domain-containing protein [Flavobacterium sp. ENC]MCD0467267.1 helix-turn-helix domain-containing protein [Flavobacterium sp. ENC]